MSAPIVSAVPNLSVECLARADKLRALADSIGVQGQFPYPAGYSAQEISDSVGRRLCWSVYAASEYLRPFLSDVLDAAKVWPEWADELWHQAAGAAIVGHCPCGSPALHRDNIVTLVQILALPELVQS